MSRRWIGSTLLIVFVLGAGGLLGARKYASVRASDAAASNQPEPMEAVTAAVAEAREHRPTVTSIGTVLATQSVTLKNEQAGTVRDVALNPGQIVDAGTVLVALDVSVEEAELAAQEAQARLAQSLLDRYEKASSNNAVSQVEVDRARAERDIAGAQMARIRAVIARKTIRAPFRSRVGLSDVHRGQYLNEGTVLTTLQGIDDVANVDFAVPQRVAAVLRPGDRVQVGPGGSLPPIDGAVVANDAKVDPGTRNALVRVRIPSSPDGPAPGASVRVEIPAGPSVTAVAVPVNALRKGPEGDHVFVITTGADGKPRAHVRAVESGPVVGDDILIVGGLVPGERVATSGSFKLREAVLVAVAPGTVAAAPEGSR